MVRDLLGDNFSCEIAWDLQKRDGPGKIFLVRTGEGTGVVYMTPGGTGSFSIATDGTVADFSDQRTTQSASSMLSEKSIHRFVDALLRRASKADQKDITVQKSTQPERFGRYEVQPSPFPVFRVPLQTLLLLREVCERITQNRVSEAIAEYEKKMKGEGEPEQPTPEPARPYWKGALRAGKREEMRRPPRRDSSSRRDITRPPVIKRRMG